MKTLNIKLAESTIRGSYPEFSNFIQKTLFESLFFQLLLENVVNTCMETVIFLSVHSLRNMGVRQTQIFKKFSEFLQLFYSEFRRQLELGFDERVYSLNSILLESQELND